MFKPSKIYYWLLVGGFAIAMIYNHNIMAGVSIAMITAISAYCVWLIEKNAKLQIRIIELEAQLERSDSQYWWGEGDKK